VDAGVAPDPKAELVWPGRLLPEINNANADAKQAEERIGDRVGKCMVFVTQGNVGEFIVAPQE